MVPGPACDQKAPIEWVDPEDMHLKLAIKSFVIEI
jgi:hypothetical protein